MLYAALVGKRESTRSKGRPFMDADALHMLWQRRVMAHQNQGKPLQHKSGKNWECLCVRIVEVGLCVSKLREQARGLPLAQGNGEKAAKGIAGNLESIMPPRQRPFSRRGTGRGGTSRPMVDNSSSNCCRCLCHRVEEANPIQSQQFLDARPQDPRTPPLPAFGTTVFSFSNAQGNSNFQAHVSVLFMEEAKEEGGEQPSAQTHPAESSKAAAEKAGAQSEPEAAPPASQPASAKGKAKYDWGPPPEGEYWIYPEDSEEDSDE